MKKNESLDRVEKLKNATKMVTPWDPTGYGWMKTDLELQTQEVLEI